MKGGKISVIALDFDGLIGDTVREGFVVSVAAWNDMEGHAKMKTTAQEELRLRMLRPFLRTAEHYYTMLKLMHDSPGETFANYTQKIFEAEAQKEDAGKLGEFVEKFYEKRKEFIAKSKKEWLALQRAYPGARRAVKTLQSNFPVFIATTRNTESAFELLREWGIGIPIQNIVGRNDAMEKNKQLEIIAKRSGVNMGEVLLADDSVEQLLRARKSGARVAFASWGYVSPDQMELSHRERLERFPGFGPKAGEELSGFIRRLSARKPSG